MNIGGRIKRLRKEKGISVEYIAEKLGKNASTIYRYESNDIKNFSYSILVPLAEILGTTPMYLLASETEDNKIKKDLKDIIKKRREELNLTYEQLGKMIGVGKSTVRKWETGMIQNMRRDNIIALSKALNISLAVIMGLKTPYDNETNVLSNEENLLLSNYNKLNSKGKEKLLDYSDDLATSIKYIQND